MALKLTRFDQTIKLKSLSSALGSPENGMMYYDSASDEFKFYQNGSWVGLGSGAGDVSGPASATDGAVAVFDGTTGKLLKNSTLLVSGDNVTVTGDLTVNGATTTVNTATLDVEDKNITVNNGGNDASSEGAGLTVERTGTDGSFIYADAAVSKFKLGALGAEVEVADISSSQTLTNKTLSANSNTISDLDTDDVAEGSNLYYTAARFNSAFSAKSTDDLSEGSSNKYYSSTLFNSDFDLKDTDDLAEGSNLYFTDARAKAAAVSDVAYAASWDAVTDVAPSKNAVYDKIESLDTDDIAEGTALYFTDSRAKTAAVLNTLAGSETDQAPSVSAVNSALAGKEDTLTKGDLTEATSSVLTISGGTGAVIGSGASIQVKEASAVQSGYLASSDFSAFDAKMDNVIDDTAPELGGDLNVSDEVIYDANGIKFGSSASNFFEEEYIHEAALAASQSGAVASDFTFALSSFEAAVIEYVIKEATSNSVRVGRIQIAAEGSNVSITDTYTDTGDVGIVFDSDINTGNVRLLFTSGSNACKMNAVMKRIKAIAAF